MEWVSKLQPGDLCIHKLTPEIEYTIAGSDNTGDWIAVRYRVRIPDTVGGHLVHKNSVRLLLFPNESNPTDEQIETNSLASKLMS